MKKIFTGENLVKFGGALLILAVFFGLKFYNKMSAENDVKDQLVSLCAETPDCMKAVDTYYKSCFEKSYSIGGRRRSGGIKADKLVDCINQSSGVNYFSAGK